MVWFGAESEYGHTAGQQQQQQQHTKNNKNVSYYFGQRTDVILTFLICNAR